MQVLNGRNTFFQIPIYFSSFENHVRDSDKQYARFINRQKRIF